ncbi:MAG: hydroxyphenylacetyl-CoA thioesterase PaaI [Actinomycetota bacterium]
MEHDPARIGDAMWADDRASQALGMELVEVGDGRAVLRMTVGPDMVNGLDVGHGGLVFTLADSAMAYSSNAGNVRSVATQAEIDWLAPVRVGTVLIATATQRHQQGKSAITDVEVVDDDGRRVALFRGRTLQLGGPVLDEPGP